jgi:hypothetical protein
MEDLVALLRRTGAVGTEGWTLDRATDVTERRPWVIVCEIGADPIGRTQSFRAKIRCPLSTRLDRYLRAQL